MIVPREAPCLSLWERWQPERADGEGVVTSFALSVTARGGASSPKGGAKLLLQPTIHLPKERITL